MDQAVAHPSDQAPGRLGVLLPLGDEACGLAEHLELTHYRPIGRNLGRGLAEHPVEVDDGEKWERLERFDGKPKRPGAERRDL